MVHTRRKISLRLHNSNHAHVFVEYHLGRCSLWKVGAWSQLLDLVVVFWHPFFTDLHMPVVANRPAVSKKSTWWVIELAFQSKNAFSQSFFAVVRHDDYDLKGEIQTIHFAAKAIFRLSSRRSSPMIYHINVTQVAVCGILALIETSTSHYSPKPLPTLVWEIMVSTRSQMVDYCMVCRSFFVIQFWSHLSLWFPSELSSSPFRSSILPIQEAEFLLVFWSRILWFNRGILWV